MCGIAGIVSEDSKKYKNNIEKMLKSLSHRGPDERGVFYFNNCVLAHTRLSIVDLQTGKQPMLSGCNNIGITFNGEIYNYKEIKNNLGYKFKTSSDTEVILALYKKYKFNLLDRLPGMFSFAIWNDETKELFCARDRFGEKPFFYAIGRNNEFIFASEIKAILASGLIEPVLDKSSLAHYLKYLYVNPSKTIYKNIHTLSPAHKLIYQGRIKSIKRYWNLPKTNNNIELSDALIKFRKLFKKAVKSQLVSDVPVGAFLSGGLDSSTIVGIASQFNKNIKTFSFGFGESINELPFARDVSEKYKTDHYELSDSNYNISELLIKMAEVYDEPFADSSNIPTFLISKFAKKYTKVILTGDGGDELLGGYSWYKPFLYLNNSNIKFDNFYFRLFIRFFKKIVRNKTFNDYLISKKYNSFLDGYFKKNSFFEDNDLFSFGLGDFVSEINICDNLDDIMKLDIENYMTGDILVKIDRASMFHGLELRSPFLDVDFASFCISLPYSLKLNKNEDKIILRKAFSDIWPESIRRRNKHGFGAPIKQWLKLPEVKELKQEYLLDKDRKIFKYLPFNKVSNFCKFSNYKAWIFLNLSIWMEKNKNIF